MEGNLDAHLVPGDNICSVKVMDMESKVCEEVKNAQGLCFLADSKDSLDDNLGGNFDIDRSREPEANGVIHRPVWRYPTCEKALVQLLLLTITSLPATHLEDKLKDAMGDQVTAVSVPAQLTEEEVLVKWKDHPDYDCSWELKSKMKDLFPHFNLDDKVGFNGGGIDTYEANYPHILYQYRKKNRD